MKINSSPNIQRIHQAYSAKPPKSGAVVSGPQDKIEISASAKAYQTAMKAVQALPDVRVERVAELKTQIEAGNYRVSSEAVAERMLSQIQAIKQQ